MTSFWPGTADFRNFKPLLAEDLPMIVSRTAINFARISELAGQGHSHRWIARRLGIDRETVGQYLRNTQPKPVEIIFPSDLPKPDDDPPGFDPANLRRCSGCGALVYLWPCLTCCLAEETGEETNETPST
jgi:hypothetical protein